MTSRRVFLCAQTCVTVAELNTSVRSLNLIISQHFHWKFLFMEFEYAAALAFERLTSDSFRVQLLTYPNPSQLDIVTLFDKTFDTARPNSGEKACAGLPNFSFLNICFNMINPESNSADGRRLEASQHKTFVLSLGANVTAASKTFELNVGNTGDVGLVEAGKKFYYASFVPPRLRVIQA